MSNAPRKKRRTRSVPARQTLRWRSLSTNSPAATLGAGAKFGRRLLPGDVVILRGTLGSGKTVFVRGLGKALGVRGGIVSPTFVLRRRYGGARGMPALNHVDAYRLGSAAALRGLFDEAPGNKASDVWCVEWGERFTSDFLGRRLWVLRFEVRGQTRRRITVEREPESC